MTVARVLIAGGGLGGVETAAEVKRRLGDRVAVTVISPEDRYLFRPDTVFLAVADRVPGLRFPLERALGRTGIGFLCGRVLGVDPDGPAVAVEVDGRESRLEADFLVLATGARTEPGLVPGFEGRVVSPWTVGGMRRLRTGLLTLASQAERGRRGAVLFLVPREVHWPAPLYELAFMTHAWLADRGVRVSVDVRFRTAEQAYLDLLGPRMHPTIERAFADRGIDGAAGWSTARVGAESVWDEAGMSVPGDLMVGFAPYRGTAAYPGLPVDSLGFVRTEPDGTFRVVGRERVYAVGDAADFPVKQGELAMLQALAAAGAISAEVLGRPRARRFRAESQLILHRGHDGLFVLAPLEETGEPGRPIRIRPDAAGRYRIGEGWLWRPVKLGLRAGVNLRHRRGRPLHGGVSGLALDAGTAVLSRLFAR